MNESLYPALLAAGLAGFFTYCDLAAVFDPPPHNLQWRPWLKFGAWWWFFILSNAALAGFLFQVLRGKEPLKNWDSWLAAAAAGAGYSALVRFKLATLPDANNTALGFEAGYEALKRLVHKRINRIVRAWRMEQSQELAETDLATLRQRALLMVGSDVLLSDKQRTDTTEWINKTAAHAETPEADRRRLLALYIITERPVLPSHSREE